MRSTTIGVFVPQCKTLRPAVCSTIALNEVMRLIPPALIVFWICCAASGCGLFGNAARTLVIEPLHYCACSDGYFSNHRHRRMAQDAWRQIERANPSLAYSPDYELGFRDGFTDFLDAGPGNVPVLPPRHYWKGRFQTPAGHQAILDWYGGFSHGAHVAAETGYRQYVTLPSYFSGSLTSEHHHLPTVAHPTAEVIPIPLPETEPGDVPRTVVPLLDDPEGYVLPVPNAWEF
jgi:hypothetical protein